MQIGELGRQCGLSRDTLRFYEREGLLGEVRRLENGYRDYDAELLIRLSWISELKSLGLSIPEIKGLTRTPSQNNCESLQQPLQNRLDRLNTAIRDLKAMRNQVVQQMKDCQSRGSQLHCSTLRFCSQSDELSKRNTLLTNT